jgi:arginase
MLTGTRAPGAGPRLRADSAGPASAARVAVSGHSRPALVHFDVEVVDSGDLPLANFPHRAGPVPRGGGPLLERVLRQPALRRPGTHRGNPSYDPHGDSVERYLSGLVTALAGVGEKAS